MDLSLWAGGRELDLGTPVNATPEATEGNCFTATQGISREARHWRGVLEAALTAAGLVN